jgi:DNA-binding response OmpR family regulator
MPKTGTAVRRPVRDTKVQVLFGAKEGRHAAILLERAIRQTTPWIVNRVNTGDAVLRALDTRQFNLVLVESKLPVVRGAEICRILRGRSTMAGVSIVVVEFERIDPDEQTTAFVAGADDYVDASQPDRSVIDRLRTILLRKEANGRSDPGILHYTNDRLVAHFDDVYVSVDGRPLVLQRLEFALLRYLVERRNRVVTRQELLDHVWNGKRSTGTRTIDVHVCRLRRKLGPVGQQLQTLVSLGYRFVDTVPSAGEKK